MTSQQRFEDTGQSIYDFMDEILVVCPKCNGCARTFRIDSSNKDWFAPRRLVCASCGHTKDWVKRAIARQWQGEPRDDYFALPLWLQAPCAGETLWAYNRDHLAFIESFVGAKHRERTRDQESGWRNKSLASRVPKWMQSAKNRAAVLQAITKLKEKLPEPPHGGPLR
jgi:hypothetical protein